MKDARIRFWPPRGFRFFRTLSCKGTVSLAVVVFFSTAWNASADSTNIQRKAETQPSSVFQQSIASYYAHWHQGRATANGESFDMNQLTAAHRSLPFGTRVKVTRLDNKRSVTVRINDRGPYVRGRAIDLSLAAARKLDIVESGLTRVRIEIITPQRQVEAASPGGTNAETNSRKAPVADFFQKGNAQIAAHEIGSLFPGSGQVWVGRERHPESIFCNRSNSPALQVSVR